jgi:hypothetical protein
MIDCFALRAVRGDGVPALKLPVVMRKGTTIGQNYSPARVDRRNSDDLAIRKFSSIEGGSVGFQLELVPCAKRE